MEERRDELARLVTLENGKPFEEAKKKESGLGREGGHEGIEEYTEVKSVVVNLD
jgi:acyl-CoA reductase-like NAD-dependent aldehyde dehydrogenase